jgi:GNAT superfamily N-acetyltransferase
VADRRPLENGSSDARVEQVTFNDGSSAVHLEFASKLDADREYLALRTGEAAYAPVPRAVRDGATGLFTEHVEGRSAAEHALTYDPNLIHSDRGRLLGFFDSLIANGDRSGFNWLVDEQHGRSGATGYELAGGIDHRHAFTDTVISPGHSPFAEPYVRRAEDGRYTWSYSPMHRSDIALVRPRLEALRAEFTALGHADWHASMMGRFEKLALFAAGERPLITHAEAVPGGRELPRSAPAEAPAHPVPAEHAAHVDPVLGADPLHGLPGPQRAAVERLLTDDGVRRMNDGLRSEDPQARAEAQVWARDAAEGLEALPVADRTTVYHYTSLSPERLAELTPGAEVTMHGVVDGRAAHTPDHGHPVELVIHSRSGADVSVITGRDQVLFGPEARFHVLAREHAGPAGIERIFLAETPRDGSALPGTAGHPETAAMTPRPMDERLQNVYDAARQETDAGVAYFHPGDPRAAAMLDSARSANPIEGVFSFDLHAGTSHARVGGERLDGRDTATLLSHEPALSHPSTPGHPLVLRSMGCRTGRGEHPLAQDIANETGRIVIAPDDEVWVDATGDAHVSAPQIGPDGRPRPLRIPPEGSWRIFVPEDRPAIPARPATHEQAPPAQVHDGPRDAAPARDTARPDTAPEPAGTHPHELRRSAPEDGTTPGDSHAARRAEIARGVASGIDHDATQLLGHRYTAESHATMAERVELVTFNDGSQAVRKEMQPGWEEQADAEELSSLVGNAVEAPIPHVYRESGRVLYMDRMDGTMALLRYPEAYEPVGLRHLGYQDTRGGRLLGLLDLLIENSDRHNGNWMIGSHDEVLGYDHNMAYHGWAPDPRSNSFVENYIAAVHQTVPGEYQIEWARNDLSRHDVELIEQRLQALRPNFERLGRTDWYDQMMDRFAHVKENASGTESLLGPDGPGPREPHGETGVPRDETPAETPPADLAGAPAAADPPAPRPADRRADPAAFSEWGDRAEAIRRALPPEDVPYGGDVMDMAAHEDGYTQVFDRATNTDLDPATHRWLTSTLEFTHEPTGIRAEIAEISYGGRDFDFMFRFTGPDGREVGFADIYTFSGLPGYEGTVAHYGNIGIHLGEHQGHGFGAELQERLENWFIGQGVEAITLHASGESGTYAWARSGFSFSDRSSFEGVVDHFRRNVADLSPAGQRDWTALESRLTPKAFDDGYGATAYELSRVGWEDRHVGPDGRLTWDGKRLLLEGPAWMGDKYLLPPEDGGRPEGPGDGRPEGPDGGGTRPEGPAGGHGPGGHAEPGHREEPRPSDGTDMAASHAEAPAPRQDATDGRARFDEWGDRAEAIRQALPPDGLPHHGNIRDIILTTGQIEPVHPEVRRWINSALGFDHPESGLRLSIDEAAVIEVATTTGEGNLLLHGEFTDAAGDRQGEMVLNLHVDDQDAHLEIALVEIYDGYRGRGIAGEVMERLENWAVGQGIPEMRLWANIDIGGYAWTLHGFDFDIRYPYGLSGLPDIVHTAESIVRSGHFSPEGLRDWQAMAHRATQEAWYTPDRVTAYEIGRIGWDARHLDDDGRMTWDGKELLRNSGWQGVRHLEPPSAPHDPPGPRDAGGPVPHPATPVPGDHVPEAPHAPFAEWGDQARAIEAALPTPDELPAGESLRDVLDNGALESSRDGFASWLGRVVGLEHPASGVRAEIGEWSVKPDVLEVKVRLYHGGDEVGFGERAIRLSADDELIATHSFLYFGDTSIQSQGFGAAWNEHLENWYISQGVTEVRLLANVDVGGYAWARSYDFSERPGMSRYGTPTLGEPPITWETSEFRRLVGWVDQHITDGRMSEQGLTDWERLRERATQEAWEQEYRLTPAEFSRIGWDARTVDSDGRMMWDGKRILLEFGKDVREGGGGGWHGVRRLEPPAGPTAEGAHIHVRELPPEGASGPTAGSG